MNTLIFTPIIILKLALQDRWPLLRGDNLVVFYYLSTSEKVVLKHQKLKSEKVALLERWILLKCTI
jgi:hypothetical protein